MNEYFYKIFSLISFSFSILFSNKIFSIIIQSIFVYLAHFKRIAKETIKLEHCQIFFAIFHNQIKIKDKKVISTALKEKWTNCSSQSVSYYYLILLIWMISYSFLQTIKHLSTQVEVPDCFAKNNFWYENHNISICILWKCRK